MGFAVKAGLHLKHPVELTTPIYYLQQEHQIQRQVMPYGLRHFYSKADSNVLNRKI